MNLIALSLLGLSFSLLGKPAVVEPTAPPNIIIFFTDDQGWTQTSVPMMEGQPANHHGFYQTPELEKMAETSMIFSRSYAGGPVCVPTRATLQFGKTSARLQYSENSGVLAASRGVDLKDQYTIPEMIKAANPDYVTGMFGKWGFGPRGPEDCGYDQTDGNTGNGNGNTDDPNDPKRIFSTADRADQFMEDMVADGNPFFMQVSQYALHVTHAALPETIDKYRNLPPSSEPKLTDENGFIYAAMIENVDTALGQLLDKVEELGITDNTYIIFTSDNGGSKGGLDPLFKGKASVWEGGIRMPTVICGPGVLQGTYCDVPIANWDFFPTINEILGGDPLSAEHDGGSILDLLQRGNDGTVQRGTKEFVFHFPSASDIPNTAMVDGDYKLVMNLNDYEYRLFNVIDDPGEQNDLKDSMPDLALQMFNRLNEYLEDVDAETLEDQRDAKIAEKQALIDAELATGNPDLEQIQAWEDKIAVFSRILDMDGNLIE